MNSRTLVLQSALLAAGLFAPGAIAQDKASDAVKGGFLFSDTRAPDTKIGWDGFLNGLRGFENFYEPIGQPIYFESPFNYSGLRFLFLHHEFADNCQLAGGDLNIVALQARVALTERLGFIATKDGYSWLNAGALPNDNGWNSIAAGVKYAFFVDRENDFVATAGVRYQMRAGEAKVLQSTTDEVSPFLSVAKGFNDFHLIGDVTYRLPCDNGQGNQIFQWDLHADYDLSNVGLKGVAPVVEIHGLHYLKDADQLGLSVGGLDYANLGSADVSGSSVIWAGVGARVKFTPHLSSGATYEFALTNHNADIMDQRITFDFMVNW